MIEDLSYWKSMKRKSLIESCVYLDKLLDDTLIENACFKDEARELDNKRDEVNNLKEKIEELEKALAKKVNDEIQRV